MEINKPIVCIQGLGFVGTAMAIATAIAKDPQNEPYFQVIGVDLPTSIGQQRIEGINQGFLPFEVEDQTLKDALTEARTVGNLVATSDPSVYENAAITLVDIPLDAKVNEGETQVDFSGFKSAIILLAERMPEGSLIIIETTVPPGTCEFIIKPLLHDILSKRGLSKDAIRLAHSYERVMPGKHYLDSIINYWRVYSGTTKNAKVACRDFLSKVINTKDYPLTELNTTTESETAKVLENSYRATNIAFMEEWGRFAERINVDMFDIVSAIRMRPTHSNIRQPGFGVGGYCLPKDPLFASYSAKNIFNADDLTFPFCHSAVDLNNQMPLVTVKKITQNFGDDLTGKKFLLMGASYRTGVGDIRRSPSETFIHSMKALGAELLCHDPYVSSWEGMDIPLLSSVPSLEGIRAIIFAVPHREYLEMNFSELFSEHKPLVVDANNVLQKHQRETLANMNIQVKYIGRGDLV